MLYDTFISLLLSFFPFALLCRIFFILSAFLSLFSFHILFHLPFFVLACFLFQFTFFLVFTFLLPVVFSSTSFNFSSLAFCQFSFPSPYNSTAY